MNKFKNILDNIWSIGWILAFLSLLPVVIYAEISGNTQFSIEYNNGDWSISCPFIIVILTGIYVIAYVVGGIALLIRLAIWIYEKLNYNNYE